MTDPEAPSAPPQAPPPRGSTVLCGLLALVTRAMLSGFIAALLVSNAANVIRVVARLARGEGSRASAVAAQVFLVAQLATVLLFPVFAILLWVSHLDRHQSGAREPGGGSAAATQGRRQGCSYGPVTLMVYVIWSMYMMVGLMILESEPGGKKDKSSLRRTGDYGSVACSLMVCVIFVPNLMIQLKDFWRCGCYCTIHISF